MEISNRRGLGEQFSVHKALVIKKFQQKILREGG